MIKWIAFDADDTLWHNESVFQATEERFAQLLSGFHEPKWVRERLFATEMKNLAHYGYGAKSFVLSMIETAIELTERRVSGVEIETILHWGQDMLRAPVALLDGVEETVRALSGQYRLMLLTKGDLFDQESKLARSGLGELFEAVEIVSNKKPETYRNLISAHGTEPEEFLMVGNSLRSDILPALEAGARAVHIPYVMTWAHEVVEESELEGRDFARLETIRELPRWLASVE